MIETERLMLRRWRPEDAAAHRAIVTDPRVIATLGAPPVEDASAEVVARQNALLDAHGYCFWAVEHRADRRFIGWCGIKPGSAPIERDTEIGWTIAPAYWRRGYAREAAAATLDWTWIQTDRARLVAITTPGNRASWGLMRRLGMSRLIDGDFMHPALAEGDPLRAHLSYAIDRPPAP